MANEYIHYLKIVESREDLNPAASIDGIERQLLHHILLSHHQDQPLLVGDLTGLSQMGSQATLHRRIKNLEAFRFIRLDFCKNDGRKRFVVPKRLADQYLVFMSQCITEAFKRAKQ